MPSRATSGPRTRVVVLSPDMAVFGEDSRPAGDMREGGIDLIRAGSAYEAVAEMLCEPAAAFVIDLRLLGTGGLGALEIARQRGIEMLAIGMVPSGLTAEDLSGVRLLARRDLPTAVRNLAALPVSGPAKPPVVTPPRRIEPPEGTYVPEPPVVSPVEPPVVSPVEPPVVRPVEPPVVSPVEPPVVSPPRRTEPPVVSPAEPAEVAPDGPAATRGAAESILTPEELAALLESNL